MQQQQTHCSPAAAVAHCVVPVHTLNCCMGCISNLRYMMQEASIIGTIEDFMWLKLHLVQPSPAAAMSTSNRQSPTATSSMLTPPYSITTLQVHSLCPAHPTALQKQLPVAPLPDMPYPCSESVPPRWGAKPSTLCALLHKP